MATKQQTKVHFHVAIPVEKAIQMVKEGNNPLYSTDARALKILTEYRALGMGYFTGCENEDRDGRCKGHPIYEK